MSSICISVWGIPECRKRTDRKGLGRKKIEKEEGRERNKGTAGRDKERECDREIDT